MKYRLLVAGIGGFFILVGLNRLAHGDFFGMNRLHLPVYATDTICAGAAIVLCALIPPSWLEKAAMLPKSKPVGKKQRDQ